jgi:hypothetical protein
MIVAGALEAGERCVGRALRLYLIEKDGSWQSELVGTAHDALVTLILRHLTHGMRHPLPAGFLFDLAGDKRPKITARGKWRGHPSKGNKEPKLLD